ncbi:MULTISPECIES: PadR family transcriptional regulator [Vagococcus]|uniref:Transcriptional regulator, PadR family n=1 Tax=Vagococcus fluvialis bH819 TaxID=1255619 RepID=A0A1X6WQ83_9ENTE|nr:MULTISPECIES: PadR family transcriptional regulator [Vagococcus]SLM85806.1 Transcriptional regulator, PadR family [Vagococcus fluvialis bH819]HCM90228.1 PadR family transcriptional regulator [Vagococcus sp.]
MERPKLPLTETVFYVLTAFKKPTYGYLAIKSIEEMSEGTVRIAAGTMYGAIENLLKQNLIEQLPSELERRKMYQTTELGNKLLVLEIERMTHCISIWKQSLKGED